MPVDLELWNKLKDFQIDDTRAQVRFTDRLAHENGWSKVFARHAIDEYKKFIYLAASGSAPVTPSDIVDQVWHLHLTFTRSYWDDMCAGILGHALHHGPTKGGSREDAKYRNQYAETLTLYREEFGTEPPVEFWPPVDARFASAPHQRWVDARTHLIIRKPKLSALWAGAALATTGALTATAATAADAAAGHNNTVTYVVGGIAATALLLLGALFAGSGKRTGKRHGKGGNGDDGSSSFIPFIGGSSSGKHNTGGEGGEGGEGGGGGDGGSGCGGGGGCGSS